MLGEAGYNPD